MVSYHNGELLAESSPKGDTISRYIPGYGVAAGWNREKNGYHYYHLDEQNSTAYITGRGGEIENQYEYDAFGVLQNSREEFSNRILYTGQQYDQTSGQYYLRARFYNPVLGRFVQEDEYRGDGLNLYAYCKNNLVVYYDPSGYKDKRQTPCKEETSVGESGAGKSGSSSGYRVRDSRRNHILEGEGPTDPGHGPNRGFTEGAFPDTWTDEQVISAIEDIANNPTSTWKQSTGLGAGNAPITVGAPDVNALSMTNKGTPVRFMVKGRNHGLNITVIVEPHGEGTITGYNSGK